MRYCTSMRKKNTGRPQRKLVELLRRQGIEHVLVTCATGNRRQSGENTNPWYGRAELPVREAEEEWEPGE